MEALKRECMRNGATIGSSAETRKQALADVGAFLRSTILKK